MRTILSRSKRSERLSAMSFLLASLLIAAAVLPLPSQADDAKGVPTSYDQVAPVLLGKMSFDEVKAKDKADKDAVMARQKKLLEERYDLAPRPDKTVTMSRGKPIPVGPAVKLPAGTTWDKLAAHVAATRFAIRGLFPKGFLPLPHPNHDVGGMVFPQAEIKLCRGWRGSISISICPSAFLPEFPPAMFLTTRPDLGDVSQGQDRDGR